MITPKLQEYWDKKFVEDIDLTIKWVKWALKIKGEEDEQSNQSSRSKESF